MAGSWRGGGEVICCFCGGGGGGGIMFWKMLQKKMFIANVAIMIPGILCTTMFIPNGYKILAYSQG